MYYKRGKLMQIDGIIKRLISDTEFAVAHPSHKYVESTMPIIMLHQRKLVSNHKHLFEDLICTILDHTYYIFHHTKLIPIKKRDPIIILDSDQDMDDFLFMSKKYDKPFLIRCADKFVYYSHGILRNAYMAYSDGSIRVSKDYKYIHPGEKSKDWLIIHPESNLTGCIMTDKIPKHYEDLDIICVWSTKMARKPFSYNPNIKLVYNNQHSLSNLHRLCHKYALELGMIPEYRGDNCVTEIDCISTIVHIDGYIMNLLQYTIFMDEITHITHNTFIFDAAYQSLIDGIMYDIYDLNTLFTTYIERLKPTENKCSVEWLHEKAHNISWYLKHCTNRKCTKSNMINYYGYTEKEYTLIVEYALEQEWISKDGEYLLYQ